MEKSEKKRLYDAIKSGKTSVPELINMGFTYSLLNTFRNTYLKKVQNNEPYKEIITKRESEDTTIKGRYLNFRVRPESPLQTNKFFMSNLRSPEKQ